MNLFRESVLTEAGISGHMRYTIDAIQAVNVGEDSVTDVSAKVGESSSIRRLAACLLIPHGMHRKGPLHRGGNGKDHRCYL